MLAGVTMAPIAARPTGAAAIRPTLTSDGSLLPPPGLGMTYGLPGPYVWDTQSARKVPAVGRAVSLYTGMVGQMEMDVFKGYDRVDPPPRMTRRPDPNNARSWFVGNSVEDYLLNGNAISLVTARGVDGWPLASQWLPAAWVYILWTPGDLPDVHYYYAPGIGIAVELPPSEIVHVKRGADRNYPIRGVGVVEQHLPTLDRVAMEEEYERSTLNGAAVPSVAIIAGQANLNQDIADQAKIDWTAKYSGPTREPAILPNGTTVVPLAWSPSDTQLVEARKASLLDVANMFNLDGYWLGSPVAGMTYKTAGPQYQQILRTSLEPVLADFEDVWSDAWLPRGTDLRFRRSTLLRDDLATTATALAQLMPSGVLTPGEARVMLGLPPTIPDDPNEDIGAPSPDASGGTDPNAPPPDATDPNAEPDQPSGG
jgi:HK97 family phage portal protein